jgi:hypothetical protein
MALKRGRVIISSLTGLLGGLQTERTIGMDILRFIDLVWEREITLLC